MNRRSLFGFLAAAPVGAIPAALAVARASDAPPDDKTWAVLTFSAPDVPAVMVESPYTFMPVPELKTRARIALGRDHHLWVKTEGGNWARLKTE